MRRRVLCPEQPRCVPRAAAPHGGACGKHRRRGHGAAPVQRTANLGSGVPHDRQDRDLTMEQWPDYLDTIADGLRRMVVTDHAGAQLSAADGIARWVAMTRATHDRDGQLFVIGNGGSAGMASHMAADAAKNGRLRAMALNDPALLTAT